MALRRDVRLRKEYLYRKSLEGKERASYERKWRIKKALEGEFLFRCDTVLETSGLGREQPVCHV